MLYSQHVNTSADLLSLIRWKEVKKTATYMGNLNFGAKLAIPVRVCSSLNCICCVKMSALRTYLFATCIGQLHKAQPVSHQLPCMVSIKLQLSPPPVSGLCRSSCVQGKLACHSNNLPCSVPINLRTKAPLPNKQVKQQMYMFSNKHRSSCTRRLAKSLPRV